MRTVTSTTAAARAAAARAGLPLAAAAAAFLVGGALIAISGANPIAAYRGMLDGAGLNWLAPWVSGQARVDAAANFQQTLIATAPLLLVGIGAAYAFKTGLFNVGGQGQYLIGLIVAVAVGSARLPLPGWVQLLAALAASALAGAAWGAIAGALKARSGASEVVTTIMLNYIAVWIGTYLYQLGGPWQGGDRTLPQSAEVPASVRLPALWGDPHLQPVHAGVVIAVLALGAYWLLLNRTATGYEARAVGLSPDAAAYAGISPARTYLKVMVICGACSGLAGGIDLLGWAFRVNTADLQASSVGLLGIAVALLGRGGALGVGCSALLFGSLSVGTSVRNLDPSTFPPQLAGHLMLVLQGVIVLFVSTPALVTAGRRLVRRRPAPPQSITATTGDASR